MKGSRAIRGFSAAADHRTEGWKTQQRSVNGDQTQPSKKRHLRTTQSLVPAMPTELLKATMTIPGAPGRILPEKTNNNEPQPPAPPPSCSVTIPLVNEVQLTAATGGAELSCYRCTIPFGVVVLIAGIVVTVVAYTFNSHGSTISYFGLVLLSAGLVLLGLSGICWKVRMEQKKERRRESQTALMAHQRSIFA
ncbi:hypothetical protein DNTS_022136 [Danionella cerebrum]|uniref:Transmembrane protein 100 n=1 Tax=Danionella cerebrum TaxID=2873325 RepID=A0A553R0P4_9TELE|nr:hypothetical protein DNTS_022136 [Danionella translucida]